MSEGYAGHTGDKQEQRRSSPGAALTMRTCLALPARMPLDEWRRIGRQIFTISDSSAWWLGDWLIYGQSEYPDRYKRAIDETGLDYQTLRNYAWVARKFRQERRRESLSFQHHAELASLPESEQDDWMDRAEKHSWSRNELRNRVKAGRRATRDGSGHAGAGQNGKSLPGTRLQVSIIPDQQQRWQDAAATVDQDLLTWIVAVLDEASATRE
ncbi:LmbU family transcriptional regulator [Kibdelosporangium phytohabitans]|nr:LmbU family transcriptional regulator [Kibdelosporangium phytohabitans]